jgi:hypothetical protein
MILEGIVTTLGEDRSVNIAPMGPIVDAEMRSLIFRPYRTSTTFQNLKRHGEGVLHVTDDVLLLAKAAIGKLRDLPPLVDATAIDGKIFADCCRWYAFQVTALDDSEERTRIEAEVIDMGHMRDFFGFNRAKHAVVEAAILATRVGLLQSEEILAQFDALRVLVKKTGGEQERLAFELLDAHVSVAFAKKLCE